MAQHLDYFYEIGQSLLKSVQKALLLFAHFPKHERVDLLALLHRLLQAYSFSLSCDNHDLISGPIILK